MRGSFMRRRDVLLHGGSAGAIAALGPRLSWARNANLAPSAFDLFQGVNSLSGAGKSAALEGVVKSASADFDVRITVCDSVSSFKKATEIDASVTIGIGNVGGSAKMTWAQSLQIDESTTSIVARARRSIGTTSATSVKMNAAGEAFMKSNEASEMAWCRLYGDSWVAGVTHGGEYIATYMFHSSSAEEKSSLLQSLKANGISGSFSGDASFQRKVDEFSRKEKKVAEIKQLITGFRKAPTLPAAEGITAFALAFGGLKPDAPDVLAFTTRGYDEVPGLVDAFEKVSEARTYFLGSSNAAFLDDTSTGLMRERQTLISKRTALGKVVATQRRYGFPLDNTATERGKILNEDLRLINAQVDSFTRNPAQAFARPNLKSESIGTPSITLRVTSHKKFGGGGETYFDDASDARVLALSQRRVHSIRVGIWRTYRPEADHFSSIETTFIYPDDRQTTTVYGLNAKPQAGELVWSNRLMLYETPLTLVECQHIAGRGISAIRLRTEEDTLETKFASPQEQEQYARLYKQTVERWVPPPGEVFMGFAGSIATASSPVTVRELYARTIAYRGVAWRN